MLLRSLALLSFLCAGCGGLQELPSDKQDYAGFWQGATTSLQITSDAQVEYTRGGFDSQTSINGGIERFEGDDFVVYAVMNFSFDVGDPPHVDDADDFTHMTINGEDVTK